MGKVMRWGILGASRFAANDMGPAIHEAHGAELVALATSSEEKAAPFKAFAPSIEVFTDYDALLASDGIDAVYIPLPNHLHVPWAMKALRAGKHVLVEKPVALKAEEIDPLIALRDETGLHCAEAFMITHHPQWTRTRELLAEGAVGELVHVDVAFSFFNPDMANIRNRPETGGGALPDIGVYAYGSVRFATGAEPVSLTTRMRRENGVDVWAQANGEMAGPAGRFTYTGLVSMRSYDRQEVVFHGTKGLIRLAAPFNAGKFGEATIEIRNALNEVRLERFPLVRQYKMQVEAFGRTVTEGAPYACPLEFSRGTQAMMDMAYAGEVAVG